MGGDLWELEFNTHKTMTEKQNKTLLYAGFTEAQIAALAAVFPVLPPPERRAEIDGFVKEAVEKMNRINENTQPETEL